MLNIKEQKFTRLYIHVCLIKINFYQFWSNIIKITVIISHNISWGKPGLKGTKSRRLEENHSGQGKMQGFDSGGKDSWRVIKPRRIRMISHKI